VTGPATFRLWAAFGTEAFDDAALASGDTAWVDITAYCEAASFRTSTRSSQFDTFAAGTGTFVLDNATRLFDPAYAAGTYYGDFKRHTPLRVTGEHSSTRYTVWSGYARLFQVDYIGEHDSVTTVQCTDRLGVLARYDLNLIAEQYEADTAAIRIGRVCDEVGIGSSYRDLGNGGSGGVLRATTWGANALEHAVAVARADGGFVYVSRDGTLVHDTRAAAAVETRQLAVQTSFGTAGVTYESLTMAATGVNYRDVVRVSGASDTVQEVDNAAANAAPVTFQLLGSELLDDSSASATAEYYAALYSTEYPTPVTLTTRIAVLGEDERTALLLRTTRDRVEVTMSPVGGGADIVADCYIDGAAHVVTPGEWRVTYTLSSADAYDGLAATPTTWLVVDGGAKGKVGTGTVAY
jgi:hypothetical protein